VVNDSFVTTSHANHTNSHEKNPLLADSQNQIRVIRENPRQKSSFFTRERTRILHPRYFAALRLGWSMYVFPGATQSLRPWLNNFAPSVLHLSRSCQPIKKAVSQSRKLSAHQNSCQPIKKAVTRSRKLSADQESCQPINKSCQPIQHRYYPLLLDRVLAYLQTYRSNRAGARDRHHERHPR
jgi:hypothetical protein